MKRTDRRKSGFTLVEAIIVLAIVGILIGALVVGITRIAKQAYLSRANDSAEVVYMALQSAVTDLKTQGRFEEVFSNEYLGDPHHGAVDNPNARFYAVPDAVLDGNAYVPGATGVLDQPLTAEELQELKDNRSLIYMVLNQSDDGSTVHPDSDLLKELINPYISDSSILGYSILVEVNRSNKTVRAAFYSEKTPELQYISLDPDDSLQNNRKDVYFRDRVSLDEKDQGYYGTLSVGENEKVSKLDNAYVKIYNDDMLTVEWGEFAPAGSTDWEAKKKILAGMTYDLYIVNAVDTSKIYYKIENITPYQDNAEYIQYSTGRTNHIPSGSGTFTGDASYGTTLLPVYDLFDWDGVSYGADLDLAATSFKTFEYDESGVSNPAAIGHRISYLPGTGDGKAGCFRLVLDSLSEAGYDEGSVAEVYPMLKWDQNFTVIVEGKYHNQGFTGSMSLSQDIANPYVEEKGLYNRGVVSSSTERGVSEIKEFINYASNRLSGGGSVDSYWWYEVAYGRHLNNIRYIVGDNTSSDPEHQGTNQNLLVTGDIDWSLQRIGRTENTDGTLVHRVTVANTVSSDLRDVTPANLKVFVPLSTGAGSEDFSGLLQSERYFDTGDRISSGSMVSSDDPAITLTIYEPYTISNLKLAKDSGGTDRVLPDPDADNVGLFETVSANGEISHLILSGITGLGNDNIGGFAGVFSGKAENLTVLADEDKRQLKAATESGGNWTEQVQTEISPWNYSSVAVWNGNHIEGENCVGGLFGSVEQDASGTVGVSINLANGTVYQNQHISSDKLNGISVVADGNYAGGIAGMIGTGVQMFKVVNTGDISSSAYAGGIAGLVQEKVRLDGADPDNADEEYQVGRYLKTEVLNTAEYQNYGKVTAIGMSGTEGSYAGGIVGKAEGSTSGLPWISDKYPILSNLRNVGYITAEQDYAGGIAGALDTAVVYNVQNVSNVHAVKSYAGGIAGAVEGKTRIEGAQNVAPDNQTREHATLNGVKIYAAKEVASNKVSAGISAKEYAGGIVGCVTDEAQINALQIVYSGSGAVSDFVKVDSSSAESGVKIIVKRSDLLERMPVSPGGPQEFVILANNAQVTGISTSPGSGEGLGTSFFVGGIAGAVTSESVLNRYSEDKGWLIKVPMRNEGNITARYGSYVGGIAGAATGKAEIYNAENGQEQRTDGVVIQAIAYAGGLVGVVDSEKDIKTRNSSTSMGSGTNKNVVLSNSEQLAWENSSAITEDYYTNHAKLVIVSKQRAGGIVGYANTDQIINNMFNGGAVRAGLEAGGLFGVASGDTSTQYDAVTLSARLVRQANSSYAVNSGTITAGSKAGGIAGAVNSPSVQLRDVFNSGDVSTTEPTSYGSSIGDFAGGIIGYVMVENPGTSGETGVLRYSDSVVSGIVMSTNQATQQKPVYTNTGNVYTLGSYAGGIVGQGSVSLVDVFNSGEIQAVDSCAGGIAGEIVYNPGDPGVQIEVAASNNNVESDAIIQTMASYAIAGNDKDYMLYQNCGNVSTIDGECAGGIAGSVMLAPGDPGDRIHVKDMYNAGHVVAGLAMSWSDIDDTVDFENVNTAVYTSGDDSKFAGGIIGFAEGVILEYRKDLVLDLLSSQAAVLREQKLVPNMGNVLARAEAGGLIGGSSGSQDDIEHVLVINGINRGVVRTEEHSAGGLVGQGIWSTIRTDKEVATAMVDMRGDPYRLSFSNLAVVIAGTDNAGGIAGRLENSIVTDVFNRGEIYARGNNAGGVVGYARNSSADIIELMEITHSEEVAAYMFADADSGDYTFTNTANVTAYNNNAGGIVGKAVGSVGTISGGYYADLDTEKKIGKVVLLNVYSGDPLTKDASSDVVIEAKNNAGGMAGRFVDAVIGNDEDITEMVLKAGIYTNNSTVKAISDGTADSGSNAGGIIGNADQRKGTLGSNEVDTRSYYTNPTDMEAYTDSNHFQVSDVYNIGEVTAQKYNAGGIFGIAGAGTYDNTPEFVKFAVDSGMLTNDGAVTANNNAGGIFGAATAKFDTNELYAAINANDNDNVGALFPQYETSADVLDVFNGGTIKANANNAGGIAGLAVHLDLRYSADTLINTMKSDVTLYKTNFLATNTGQVNAGGSNAGGIIGYGYRCILQDPFNTGTSQLNAALGESAIRVEAGGSNAGGIIGQANGLKLFYSDIICENIRQEREYVYSNVANIKAGNDSAGGIAGYAYNSVQILDTYNMGSVVANGNYAGGLIGRLAQTVSKNRDGSVAVITSDDIDDPLSAIDVANNTAIIRSEDSSLVVNSKRPYRGEDFITYENSVSYITFTTIVTGTDSKYETGVFDSFGNMTYTNRYTSMAKPGVKKTYMEGYHIVAGNSDAGGIVGYASAPVATQGGSAVMAPEAAILRVENVFSTGSLTDEAVGGVWAKGSNAGGIIGRAEYSHLTYSFDINPGPDNLDVGGTDRSVNPNSKGDHSVMTEAFNDPRVMKDPYAIDGVGLHMVANSTKVRASSYGPNSSHGNTGARVNLTTGEFTNLASKNAGGAIGSMTGGRAERLYSLKGDVVTPTNLGGVVGYATSYALVKQASRMGVYNLDKYTELSDNNQYNIFSYKDPGGTLIQVDLDGEDITAGTQTTDANATTVKVRGSIRVGGIVGYATDSAEVLDTRNLVNVQGRAFVGGIVGEAGKNVNITLAHNMQSIVGKVNSPEDDAHKSTLITVSQMKANYLDRSAVDGSYIGGIVGKTYDTGGLGMNPTIVMMAKSDPLMTQNFEERLTQNIDGRMKDVRGGNFVNNVDGRRYVGGITGAHGVVNYAYNTGRVTGVEYIGGVSGQGYRITNSFNTADIDAENNYLYSGKEQPVFSQAVFVGGIAGQIGHRNTAKLQNAEPGSYIKNSYNASSRVNAASIVGGIAGYAISPIETTYNSATISTDQTNLGNSGSETAETGNKVGGIVGQVAQDKADKIQIIDSYNSGIVGGTGDTGGILGFVEYYADGEIINETEYRKRIKNSYFIKDSSVRYYSVLSGQVSMEINATLRALNLDAHYPIDEFMFPTATSSDLKKEHVVDSDYGARNYSNMISNEYMEYRNLLQQTIGGGAALTGEVDLQIPLNTGKSLNWQGGNNITQESNSNSSLIGTAKFVFPYDSSGTGLSEPIQIGRDYEFLHLDFSGQDSNNEEGIPGIQLDPTKKELENSNQWFVSADNTASSNFFNVWPTRVINYMKVDVSYNDGGSAEDTEYVDNGTKKKSGTAKATLASQVNKIGIPLWQVNYNYTGTNGDKNNHVPTSVFTPETLTLKGRFSKQGDKLPRIMKFNIYDGFSRGDYSYDNSQFTVKMVENQIQKTYVLISEDEWIAATASWSDAAPAVSKEIEYLYADGTSSGKKFYFYIENNVSTNDMEGTNAADIMELIEVKLQEQTPGPGEDPEIEWKVTIPSMEMDTYLGAKSGFFTAEAVKIYDEADGIGFDHYTTWERTSRMFNMHFSNYYSSKDPGQYVGLDYNHNKSVYDQYPNLDLDDFEDGKITKAYNVADSAALGSVKLILATSSDVVEYVEQKPNRLQIANERHLYNLNKNQNQGTAEIDSYLPYVNKDIQLITDVEMSTDNGYNCFIIGLSKGSFNRMTGSLDGMGMDGKVHTIGNLQVDMTKSMDLPNALESFSYGLIYDLSGGVVKNLQIGFDSRIRAEQVGALAYQASNGKSGTDVLNNPWYENLAPELRIEEGADAKIYNTRVNADISGLEVGGYVYHTVRRFESSRETKGPTARDPVDTLTITNSEFGGKINTIKGSYAEDRYVGQSVISAGFLCRMKGWYDDNNLLESSAGGAYPQNTYMNGSEVTEDAYIYGKEYAAGIVGAVDNIPFAQVSEIRKTANNGTVLSTKRASGISQGIMDNDGDELDKSGVDVWYSYNNGIVQTPDDSGLASGIGNVIRLSAYTTNNGSVIGRIASGISNYGARNMKIVQSANNGYVRGKQIAGGIVAAPARYNASRGMALPYRTIYLTLQLENCYNVGTVVVTTNVDNSRYGGNIDSIYNSYAGGIIGMALLYDRNVDWFNVSEKYYLSKIEEDDDRITTLRNCYNAGRVYYEDGGNYSLNHRYVGGIAGGGLHRFIDIQDCYNLSDSEAMVGTTATMYQANVNLGSYSSVTPSTWKQIITPKEPIQDKAYNYNLTAVGDMPYGENVATMTFADMLNLKDYVGFSGSVWTIDHTSTDVNGYIYPFPQFSMSTEYVGELYVGDDYQAAVEIPDAIFNVNINKEKFNTVVSETAEAILVSDVTDKTVIPASITYAEVKATGELGAFDKLDAAATPSNANPVELITESRYTINLGRTSSDYDVYIYDGDADATGYAPTMIRRYEVRGGIVTSGGKLHDEQSTLTHEMQYFNTAPGGRDYAEVTASSLTIGDKESVGWYMPIHGYYTAVVAERGSAVSAVAPTDYNDRIHALARSGATKGGGINVTSLANSSERFQVHFSGKSIEGRSGTYASGSAGKPYEVTDQYSVIGMTTAGIAQKSTDRKYFQQVKDIAITEHVLPMFEFNGNYDAANPAYSLGKEPVMNGNFTISYQTEKGDFGFINYLAPTREALEEDGFIPTVSNLNILVEADGEYSDTLGRYFEAANYTTSLGLVADYAEYAKIEGITTLGNVVYGDTDPVSYRSGFFGDGSVPLGGVVGIMKNTVIEKAKNNATLGVEVTPQKGTIDGMEVSWTVHANPAKGVQVAGITAVAVSNNSSTPQAGKMEYVFNNGELRAAYNRQAAGIAHTVNATDMHIRYAANSGWVRTMNGGSSNGNAVAAGLVYKTRSKIEDGYNSGLVTAGAVKGKAAGNAVGLFWDVNGNYSNVNRLYNAGVVRGNRQGAITQGTKISALQGRAYYLKDEDLYWMDSSSLPDSMEITDEKEVELYMGFAYVPVEVYGFSGDEALIKAAEAASAPGMYDSGDPYAVTYKEITDSTEMASRGFDNTTWDIIPPTKGPEIDGTFIREYQDDDYPLPQFKRYPHLTRRHMGFPVFLGGSKEVAKVPYEASTQIVRYVPLDYQAGERDETFKDTIAVDLNDFSTTAKYRVAIYEGPPEMSEDIDGKLQYDAEPVLDITVERRYIDTRDMTFSTSVGKSSVITPQAVGNALNKEFGELFSNERGAYFYEVNALDISGKERPATFEVKEFLAENRVELLLNNDVLDTLREPGVTDPTMTEAYYTVTVVEAQVPLKKEETDWNNYYSKFSPHFANATAKQSEAWDYGTSEAKPYEIATQRNLYNIGKGTDVTAYLGNHYKQTQDIRLSAKKADAAIANGAPNSIGVSQYNTTGASPTVAKATVMKSQADRPELWTKAIGAVNTGVTELGFRGTYTATNPSVTPSGPDDITGGFKLIDTRTNIKSSIFGRVSSTAKISDVGYELRPTAQSGTVETLKHEVTVALGVKALLIEENMGTVDNILFANAEDGNTKAVTLPSGAELFALAIGETSPGSAAPVPAVSRIAVQDGYQIKPNTTSSKALAMGSVIGRVSDGANLELLESAATITLAQSSSSQVPKDTIGLLVGEIKSDGTGTQAVSFTKSSSTGSMDIRMPISNKAIGGVVGNIQDAEVVLESVVAGNLDGDGKPEAQIFMSTTRTAANAGYVGGIVGTVRGGDVTLKESNSYYKISTENVTDNVIGGMIGSVEASAISAADATKVLLASDSNASVSLEDNGRGNNILGGVIGQVAGAAEVGINGVETGDADAEDIYAIVMKTNYTGGINGKRIAGGIIGKVYGPDAVIEMTDVVNRLSILADDTRGRSGYYLGGLIGQSENAILYLHDTDETEDSNLVNQGHISLTNRNTSSNTIYAAGGIGYMKDSPADVFGMRNTGDVTITANDLNTTYNGTEAYIAGVVGYAEGKLEGITVDDIAGTITVSEALSIRESLNTGAIRDERNMPDVTGGSTAAGIVSRLEGNLASADTEHPVQIVYNHNSGDVRGIRAAGILTDISEDWISTIVKTDTSDTIETPVDIRYNVSINPIDAGYEEEDVEGEVDPVRVITGSDITLVYELPLAKAPVEGIERELDGYDIAELLRAERDAFELATPSDATSSDATPSEATPSNIAYYNAALEDMVKAPDYDSESELPVLPVDRVSGAILSLGQMQSLVKFQEETKWGDEIIDDESAASGLIPPKWIMTEGQGPGVTQNRYIPPGGFGRLATAPRLVRVDIVPMEVTVRTWELVAVPVATGSDATGSDATSSDVEYKLVEVEKEIEADGIELSWEYTGIIPEAGKGFRSGILMATGSDATSSEAIARLRAGSEEDPEFEFAVIWEVGGRLLKVVETGVLDPDDEGAYHFTITPEMAAEALEYLSYEGILDVEVSIGVLIDGRLYRGVSETTTFELVAMESSVGSGRSYSGAYLSWLEDDSLSDYSGEIQMVVNYGMSRMGDPYSQALAGVSNYVDCSYFVMDSYRQLGIELPRTAAAQAQYLEYRGLTVSEGNLKPGDLIFYSFEKNGRYKNISHVAMYIGGGMVVDASSSQGEVVTRGIYGLGSVVSYGRPLGTASFDDVVGDSDEVIIGP